MQCTYIAFKSIFEATNVLKYTGPFIWWDNTIILEIRLPVSKSNFLKACGALIWYCLSYCHSRCHALSKLIWRTLTLYFKQRSQANAITLFTGLHNNTGGFLAGHSEGEQNWPPSKWAILGRKESKTLPNTHLGWLHWCDAWQCVLCMNEC